MHISIAHESIHFGLPFRLFLPGVCALGPRDVVEVMQNVNEFLDKNPTETIIFIYQVDNDAEQRVDLNAFYDKLLLVDGLIEKLYVHDGPDTPWPTLRQLTNPEFNKVRELPREYRAIHYRSGLDSQTSSNRTHRFLLILLLHFVLRVTHTAHHHVPLQRPRLQHRSRGLPRRIAPVLHIRLGQPLGPP